MQETSQDSLPSLSGKFDRNAGIIIFCLALAAGSALRAWFALTDYGINWPDEIFNTLEPGHRLAFGYGLQAWEYVEGAHNWVLPGIIAGILKLCAFLGLNASSEYIVVIRMAFVAVGVATIAGCWRLARVLGASQLAAAAGAAFFALSAPAVFFSPRAMFETSSALPVVFGFALALHPQPLRWQRLLGISLLGIAVLLRLQNAVFCFGILGILAARREWRFLLESLGVFAAWGLFLGLLDRLTWGHWFQSAIVYLKFNLVDGSSANWGTSPAWFYADALWASMGPAVVIIALCSLLAACRAPGLLLVAAAFLLIHSYIPHKELRFVIPSLPLLCALAAVGIQTAASKTPPVFFRICVVVLIAIASMSAGRFQTMASEQIGSGSVNRLLLIAGKQADLQGLKVENAGRDWTGGYSYLHRNVPLYGRNGPARESHFYNYIITDEEDAEGGEVIARDHGVVLVRISRGKCLPDPAFNWRVSQGSNLRLPVV